MLQAKEGRPGSSAGAQGGEITGARQHLGFERDSTIEWGDDVVLCKLHLHLHHHNDLALYLAISTALAAASSRPSKG